MPKSLAEIAAQHDTDKAVHTHYLENYERYFESIRNSEVRLLELGIKKGGSLLMWRDYFENGLIAGLDIEPASIHDSMGRIKIYQGPQQDKVLLDRIARECAPDGFDIVIDDCSHIGVLARESFWHLFDNYLKTGGWYVVEDWGTGYWQSWVDGAAYRGGRKRFRPLMYRATRVAERLRSLPAVGAAFTPLKRALIASQFAQHDYGMVGFVKELIDELAIEDRTHPQFGNSPPALSPFSEMHLTTSHVFIRKR